MVISFIFPSSSEPFEFCRAKCGHLVWDRSSGGRFAQSTVLLRVILLDHGHASGRHWRPKLAKSQGLKNSDHAPCSSLPEIGLISQSLMIRTEEL